MTQQIPEGIVSSAPGIEAAEAYPYDFEGFKQEELPASQLIIELAGEDNTTIVSTLMSHVDSGKITQQTAEYVLDQIAILRAQHELSV